MKRRLTLLTVLGMTALCAGFFQNDCIAQEAATPASTATQPLAKKNTSIRRGLVRITTTSQEPNYKVPWNPGALSRSVGTGFVIEGNRILTNAHVVSNARFISVEREDDPQSYTASIKFIGHDCDLAIIELQDQHFFDKSKPLPLGGVPELESIVYAYGYPIGGNRLSVTQGIVSRVDFQTYTHSGIDSHLAIQISAPINPGNSGGPVMQNGKVVGVAFQGYSGDVAQNTGYAIPVPVIQHFLKDVESGKYDHYVDLAISTLKLINPAQRAALGLTDKNADQGIFVSTVIPEGSSAGVLKDSDVILAIDGKPVSSDGFVQVGDQRVQMEEVVERKFAGDTVKLDILRDHKPLQVTVTLKPCWPFTMQANSYDEHPRFILFGGILFEPLSRDFLKAFGIDDLQVRYFYEAFVSHDLFVDHPDVIVIGAILNDPITTYLAPYRFGIVDKVNGKKIRYLEDLSAAFAEPQDYYVIELVNEGRPLVLERKEVEAARARIRTAYNVTSEQYLGTSPGKVQATPTPTPTTSNTR